MVVLGGIYTYIFGSILAVSLIALIGILTLGVNRSLLDRVVLYLVAFSAGGLFGDTFIHIIPEIAHHGQLTHLTGLYIMSGVVFSFIVETFIHWHHHHRYEEDCEDCVEPFTYMVLLGDATHNFIDGTIIAASYLASIPVGIATTIAVMLHEIPQEIGDYGVLVHGGFSRKKALFYNFVTALTAFLGAGIVILLSAESEEIIHFMLPFAAGGFVYIAGSDLLPELQDKQEHSEAAKHALVFVLGVAAMYALTFLE